MRRSDAPEFIVVILGDEIADMINGHDDHDQPLEKIQGVQPF